MSEAPSARGFQFEDSRQARIFERLRRLIGEGPAHFFRDACRILISQQRFHAGSHLAAHALRETEGALRQVLEPFEDGAPVPKNTENGNEKSIRKVCSGLQVQDDNPLVLAWLSLAGKGNSDALHARAHRDDLLSTRPMDAAFRSWFDRVLAVLDVVLERTEASYSAVFLALDTLLEKVVPDAEDINQFKGRVPSTPLTHGYFFERLEHAAWLQPLADAGLLTLVPPLDRNEEEGTIGFPAWPAKPYMLRMASTGERKFQESVLTVLKALPATDNTRMHADVAEIGTVLPADLARQLVDLVDRGLREPHHLGLPHQAAPFIVHLAESGCLDEATHLTNSLFEVLPDPAPPESIDGMTYPPSPRARMQDVIYEHELAKVGPALIAADPCRAASTFAELLAQAVRYSQTNGGNGKHSHSQAWWPALDADQRLDEPREYLLDALLSAADECVEQGSECIRDLVKMLKAHGWLVFTRVALHLLVTDDAPSDLADGMATDLELHDDSETLVEHTVLLRKRFPHLDEPRRTAILAHLTAAPDPAEQRKNLESWMGRSVSDAEAEQDMRRRMFSQLRTLEGVLPPELQSQYETLAAEFLAEEPLPLPTAGWGNRSPKSSGELLDLSDDELLTYVMNVKLGHDPFGPSMEGLGESLADIAAQKPERFSLIADRFVGADPSLVSGLLRGLETAAKSKKAIAWDSIFRLCRWVVEQPREIPGRTTRYSDLDPGWVWTRRQIASLLLQGLQEQPGAIEFSLRSELWPVIAVLLTDPDPAETRLDDPLTTALNSVRGEAIRAAMDYGLWVRRALPDPKTFEKMPEVRDALEAHLDPSVDSSPAIRAVYGELIAVLYHLDEGWLRENFKKLFPDEQAQTIQRRATWDSYVRYRNPLIPMLPELEAEYRKAIERAGQENEADKKPESAARRLAEHIMMLGWQGHAPLEDPEGLVATFFRVAPLPLRAHAMEFTGRALKNTEGPVEPDVLARITRVWEMRLTFARTASVESVSDELAAFGWWFASKKLEKDWALTQLKEVLDIAGEIDWEHQVVETLAEWSESSPAACVECLDLLMQRERERWGFELSLGPARKVLESALKSSDPDTRRRAREVVNRLDSRGHHGFRDLLS